MTICVNCGVELDDGIEICPLCGNSPANKRETGKPSFSYPSEIIQLQKKESRRYLWELISIIAFSGIAVCTIVDLLTNKGLKWSLISDASIIVAWVSIFLLMNVNKRILVLVPGLFITISVYLYIINLITSGKNWFVPVGLPITIAAFISAGIIIILYRAANLRGLNIFAAAFIVLSGFCIITEIILDKYFQNCVALRWSLIAAVSMLPVALILTFYYYRLKRGNHLDSFFHV